MSQRKEILERALFDTGGEVCGITFDPLSPPAVMILRRRKNVLVVPGSVREQDETEAISEILFVLSRTPEQRTAMFRDSDEVWNLKALEFMAGLPHDALKHFGEDYLAPAMNALAMAQTESEGPGKSGASPSPATSPSFMKGRGKSGSTTLPGRSGSKTRSGKSPSAPSSSSSSRTRSGKGIATGGSTGLHRRKS